MAKRCVWCANPDATEEPADPEKELCRSHLAELYGMSETTLDRAEAIEQAEYNEWVLGY